MDGFTMVVAICFILMLYIAYATLLAFIKEKRTNESFSAGGGYQQANYVGFPPRN